MLTDEEHLEHLRTWHAMVAPRMLGFSTMGPQFDFPAYGRWCDVGVLLRRETALTKRLAELERDLAVISKASTDVQAIPGGPCEAHYVKGWNDAIRAARPVARAAFNRGRIEGKDLVLVERWVIDAIDTCRRTQGRPAPQPPVGDTTAIDPWEGSR